MQIGTSFIGILTIAQMDMIITDTSPKDMSLNENDPEWVSNGHDPQQMQFQMGTYI